MSVFVLLGLVSTVGLVTRRGSYGGEIVVWIPFLSCRTPYLACDREGTDIKRRRVEALASSVGEAEAEVSNR